jgi:hypothetical protein
MAAYGPKKIRETIGAWPRRSAAGRRAAARAAQGAREAAAGPGGPRRLPRHSGVSALDIGCLHLVGSSLAMGIEVRY